jgi:hypothetical protein
VVHRKKAQWQAGRSRIRELVKKSEWQPEQPVHCPSRRYAGHIAKGRFHNRLTAKDFQYMAIAEVFDFAGLISSIKSRLSKLEMDRPDYMVLVGFGID